MTTAEIVWWEVETPEPEAFQQFHQALWGWSFTAAFQDTELNRDYWIISAGDRTLGGLQRAASNREPRAGVRLYLEVDDLEATLRRVDDLGGRIERGRTFLGGNDRWFANVVDPAGIAFGLWTARPAGVRQGQAT